MQLELLTGSSVAVSAVFGCRCREPARCAGSGRIECCGRKARTEGAETRSVRRRYFSLSKVNTRTGRDGSEQTSWSVVRRLASSSLGGSDGTGALSQSQIRRRVSWSKQQEQVEDAEAALDGRRERGGEAEERARWRGQERKATSSEQREEAGRLWTNASGLWVTAGLALLIPLDRLQDRRRTLETLGLMRNTGGWAVPACARPGCDYSL
jgi:hypothetical protein